MNRRYWKIWWVLLCVAMAGCAGTGPKSLDSEGSASVSSYTAELKRRETPRDIVPINMTNYTRKVDNFLLIFDPSASMSVPYQGRTKFDLAMETALHFNRTIPDLELTGGIRTFGHPMYTSMIYGFSEYSRTAFENSLLTIENTDGVSPLEIAISEVQKDFFSLDGTTAIILISDGVKMDLSPVLAARNLVEAYRGQVCIYTIVVGDDPVGTSILEDIATESECGFSVNADALASGEQMADFVRKVFLTEASPQAIAVADEDGDGVEDAGDDCLHTPEGLPVDDRGCWKIGDVLFDFDKYDIKPEYNHVLDEVSYALIKYPEIRITIEGHTDIIGPERYNDTLSINRANAGKNYLLNKGVPSGQIDVKGFGYSMPRDTNDTVDGRAQNRRIEFRQMHDDY